MDSDPFPFYLSINLFHPSNQIKKMSKRFLTIKSNIETMNEDQMLKYLQKKEKQKEREQQEDYQFIDKLINK